MKARAALLMPLVVAGCVGDGPGTSATDADQSPAEIEAEVLRLDSLWFAGYEQRDTALVARVLAESFTGNAAGAEIDRSGALTRVAENRWERYSLDWVDVDIVESVAIVRAHRTAYRFEEGTELSSRFAYLDVYARIGEEWRCVSGQSSVIAQ